MQRQRNAEAQGHRDAEMQRHRDAETLERRDAEMQGCRNAQICRCTKTRRCRDAELVRKERGMRDKQKSKAREPTQQAKQWNHTVEKDEAQSAGKIATS